MPRKFKPIIQSLEDWVTEVITEDSSDLARDIHFDFLGDRVRETAPGLGLAHESCELLERVQSIAKDFDLGTKEWTLLTTASLDWTKRSFPAWNERFWKEFGKYIEPPSLVIIRGLPGKNNYPEYYFRQIDLPFDGFPNLKATCEAFRTEEEIRDGDPIGPRIRITHKYPLGKAP